MIQLSVSVISFIYLKRAIAQFVFRAFVRNTLKANKMHFKVVENECDFVFTEGYFPKNLFIFYTYSNMYSHKYMHIYQNI